MLSARIRRPAGVAIFQGAKYLLFLAEVSLASGMTFHWLE